MCTSRLSLAAVLVPFAIPALAQCPDYGRGVASARIGSAPSATAR